MSGRVAFTAWEFDAKFHVLQGPIEIRPELNHRGEQIYRIPANATLVAPPECVPQNKRLVFLESTQHWLEISDHRGETWFDIMGRPTVIERLGNPEHWNMTREPRFRSGSGEQSCSSCTS